jgi:hypothetical protein
MATDSAIRHAQESTLFARPFSQGGHALEHVIADDQRMHNCAAEVRDERPEKQEGESAVHGSQHRI